MIAYFGLRGWQTTLVEQVMTLSPFSIGRLTLFKGRANCIHLNGRDKVVMVRKSLLIAFLLLCGLLCQGQSFVAADTIFDFGLYRSCYSYQQAAPAFVVYRLYKPLRNVSRGNLAFRELPDIRHFEYKGTPYDRGHMCAAADCAASLVDMEKTFYYVNVIPQHYKLNRGSWKRYETAVRSHAWTDSLLVVCGGADWGASQDLVPGLCWKIVYSMTDTIPVMELMFENNASATVTATDTLHVLFPYHKVLSIWRGSHQGK